MTKWFVDPSYDPMQDLQDCKEYCEIMKVNAHHMTLAINDQQNMIAQLNEQNKRLLRMISNANQDIVRLYKELELMQQGK